MSQKKLKEKRVVIILPAQVAALKAIYDGLGPEAEKLGWDFSKPGQVILPKNQVESRDGCLTGLKLTASLQGNWFWSNDFLNALVEANFRLTLRSSASTWCAAANEFDEPDENGNEFDEEDDNWNYIVRDPDEEASLKAIYEKITPAARCDKKIVFTAKGTARTDSSVVITRAGRVARLDLFCVGLSDLRPLAGLTALTELDISGNRVSDLKPLAGLSALTELNINRNQISDLKPLANLNALTYLDISSNPIRSLKPLASLEALESLYFTLTPNSYRSLGALLEMNSLEGLRLEMNLNEFFVKLYFYTDQEAAMSAASSKEKFTAQADSGLLKSGPPGPAREAGQQPPAPQDEAPRRKVLEALEGSLFQYDEL